MRLRKTIEKIAEWVTKPVLLALAAFFAWDAITGTPLSFVVVFLLLEAAFYREPPWRNVHLMGAVLFICALLAFAIWWVATALGGILLVSYIFGQGTPVAIVFILGIIISLLVQYLLFQTAKKILNKYKHRAGQSAKDSFLSIRREERR